jgi:hypothetical protein
MSRDFGKAYISTSSYETNDITRNIIYHVTGLEAESQNNHS